LLRARPARPHRPASSGTNPTGHIRRTSIGWRQRRGRAPLGSRAGPESTSAIFSIVVLPAGSSSYRAQTRAWAARRHHVRASRPP
jgi:hypothetical protein